MDAQVINFKAYSSGAMAGFFDLVVSGITVTGCKAFKKEDKVWFAWPAEKTHDKEGNDHWREIVTASEPVIRHLQGLVRPQLRALILGNAGGNQPRKPSGEHSRSEENGERAYQESRRAAQVADDIQF
jgi:hypothetical protein